MARRSFWAWGTEDDEPTMTQVEEAARRAGERWGITIEPVPPPKIEEIELRTPRATVPEKLRGFCTTETFDRARHTYGKSFADSVRAYRREFANPPDVVAYPRSEEEVVAVLEWCDQQGHTAIPWGGGSSVVGGLDVPADSPAAVSINLERMNRVLEVDATSRAARIQAGALGPEIEEQLRPHGLTLRHYPQSFEWSALGGWIATRSGGHYATNHTHIDDFVESVRMVTPRGAWESRRLPGSGAGPSPDRLAIGSEGILGIITEAWMRVQARPVFRASAGVRFPTWESGYDAARAIVQSKLWPANCRLLDPQEAQNAAGADGSYALLVLGFESGDLPQGEFLHQALRIAREAGGTVPEDEIVIKDDQGAPGEAGRQGAVGAWRNAFIRAPYARNINSGLGTVGDTFETSMTWDRWPEFDRNVRAAVNDALKRVCGEGTLTCRFTHVYPDGPAPYYTYAGPGKRGGEIEMWWEVKQAALEAVWANGGTVTHHHAVGRDHRPWYDRQRPDLFADALRAAKKAVDPKAILNPGVLIDP